MELRAERTVSTGSQNVYVYFYEADRQIAVKRGEDRWKCKIGSASNPSKRISKQQSAMNSPVALGLVIRTEGALIVEKQLQGKLKKLRVDCPGNEWFLTSPSEIEEVWKSLDLSQSYGWVVRKARMRKRLSQKELAKFCDIRQGTVSDVENDEGVRLGTLLKIFKVLGIQFSFSLPEEKREYISCLPGGGGG